MDHPADKRERRPAVVAQALYLTNLLLLPGVAFLVLGYYWLQYRHHSHPLVRCHVQEAFAASILAGVLLVVVPGLALLAGGSSMYVWMYGLVYVITMHAAVVLLGAYGLARAAAGKHLHLPLLKPGCR